MSLKLGRLRRRNGGFAECGQWNVVPLYMGHAQRQESLFREVLIVDTADLYYVEYQPVCTGYASGRDRDDDRFKIGVVSVE